MLLTLKPCVCLQLEDMHHLSEMNGASANVAREELRESSLRIESLTAQLAALQKEVEIPFCFWKEFEMVCYTNECRANYNME